MKGSCENFKIVREFLIKVYNSKVWCLMVRLDPYYSCILEHRYGLGEYLPLPLNKLDKILGMDQRTLWNLKEEALYILGFSKEYKNFVISVAISKQEDYRKRQVRSCHFEQNSKYWSSVRCQIAELLRQGYKCPAISKKLEIKVITVQEEARKLLQGKWLNENPLMQERKKIFQKLLQNEISNPKEEITFLILKMAREGKTSREIEMESGIHSQYISCLIKEVRIELSQDDDLGKKMDYFPRGTRTIQEINKRLFPLYQAFRQKLDSNLSPREKEYLSWRLKGWTQEDIISYWGLSYIHVATIELAFTNCLRDSKRRCLKNRKIKERPPEIPAPPLTEEEEKVKKELEGICFPLVDRNALYPLTTRQAEILEALITASEKYYGMKVIQHPAKIINQKLGKDLQSAIGYIYRKFFVENRFLLQLEKMNGYVLTDRPYTIGIKKRIHRRFAGFF